MTNYVKLSKDNDIVVQIRDDDADGRVLYLLQPNGNRGTEIELLPDEADKLGLLILRQSAAARAENILVNHVSSRFGLDPVRGRLVANPDRRKRRRRGASK